MIRNEILIASHGEDSVTVEPVARLLRDAGREVLFYESDKVATGAVEFSIRLTGDQPEITYDGQEFVPEAILAAWSRRPNEFGLNDVYRKRLLSSYRAPQVFLWNMVPRDAWLNEPWSMQGAEHNKLDQLVVARKLGFEVPRTIVSNDWGTVDDTLAHEEAVVFKPFQSIMYDPNGVKLMFTRSSPSVKDMPHDALPYPGIFQNFAGKAREWRVTVVGDETFDAAVYTHEDAKNDWRERQADASKVTWRKEKLDDDVHDKCIAYLGHYGLRFGTFDFCEDADGKVVFLEMNPNGQYGWLEHKLGLPISRAIANELLSIAQKNS